MDLIAQYGVMLQVIAAFLVFVASYLGLVVFAVLCLFIGDLVSEHFNTAKAYGANSGFEIDSRSEGASLKLGVPKSAFERHVAKWI